MVAPLNFAKLDNLDAGNSTGKLENLDRLLLKRQITVQLNCFQGHSISQRNIGYLGMALL